MIYPWAYETGGAVIRFDEDTLVKVCIDEDGYSLDDHDELEPLLRDTIEWINECITTPDYEDD